MTSPSPEQKLIEEQARDFLEYEHKRKTVPGIAPPNAHQYYEALDHIRALLAELAELRKKAEALEWFAKRLPISMRMVVSELDDLPPILRQMIEQREHNK